MSAEQNTALARRFMEAKVTGDLKAMDEMMAPDYVNHTKLVPGQQPGPEGEKRAIAQFSAAFSKSSVHFEDQVAAGDKVVSRCIVHRTHDRGKFMGVAPTGREMTLTVIVIHRISGGKVADEWGIGTIGSTLRGQLLEQERIERERIEQELLVARRTSKPRCPRRCPPWRAGRSLPSTSQLGRWEEISMISWSYRTDTWDWSWGTQLARVCRRR